MKNVENIENMYMLSEPARKSAQTTWCRNHQDAVSANRDFDALLNAMEAATLEMALRSGARATRDGKVQFTCFAPTEKAFSKLPRKTLEDLLNDPDRLIEVINYHTIEGKLTSKDILRMGRIKTLQGEELMVEDSKGVRINGAEVVRPDIEASNGVIHIIDTVLIPGTKDENV